MRPTQIEIEHDVGHENVMQYRQMNVIIALIVFKGAPVLWLPNWWLKTQCAFVTYRSVILDPEMCCFFVSVARSSIPIVVS
jgi:hypothetical protein